MGGLSPAEQLRAALSDSAMVVTPESAMYQQSIERWSLAAEKPASIVVSPTSSEDVSKVILFCTLNGLDIAVCGGGHATSGSSSTDGGLCMNLSRMRAVSVDPGNKTVTAQGGALWADVDKATEKFGLAVVGGTVNHTGVGGLTLHGGYGHLTPEHGLVLDNLLEVELVLANGKVIIASSESNQDLFWGIRGAGSSFGVCTSFVFRAHEQENLVWGGVVVLSTAQLEKVVIFSNRFMEVSDEKSNVIWAFAIEPVTEMAVITAALFYNGPETEAKALYAPLLSLELLGNTTSMIPYSTMNTIFNEALKHGYRRSMKGSAFIAPLSTEFAESVLRDITNFVQRVPDAALSIVAFEFTPYKKVVQVPQTATAFANRGAYGNMVWIMGWTKKEHDSECRDWTRQVAAKAKAELEVRRASSVDQNTRNGVGEYFNYDGIGEKGERVFGVNFARLASLKKRYDPGNIFRNGYKLL